jgi:hypothetical protein
MQADDVNITGQLSQLPGKWFEKVGVGFKDISTLSDL